jgi:hypothetical protein
VSPETLSTGGTGRATWPDPSDAAHSSTLANSIITRSDSIEIAILRQLFIFGNRKHHRGPFAMFVG